MINTLPLLRGSLINKFRVPVILRPSEDEPGMSVDVEEGADDMSIPDDVSLPVVIQLRDSEGAQTVRAEALPGVQETVSPDDSRASDASRRGAVVAGRVAVITGGAQGFGEEMVRALHSSGAWVFIADLNLEGAQRLANELGERATAVQVNVADEDSVVQLVDAVVREVGGVDLVISNAGIARAGSVLEQPLKDFAMSTDVNYVAFFLITQHFGRILRDQNRTAPEWSTDIIQINSKSGLQGSNRNAAYAGSKFGGIGLVQSFALELVDYRIKVNAICPGNFLDGPLWSDPINGLFVQYWKSGKVPGAQSVDDVRRYYEAKVPMRRGAFGSDAMKALYYLVEQTYETGQALPVTGGQVMLT